MGKSILTRNAAAFEAANVAKGITPSRDIRKERIEEEQARKCEAAKRKARREKADVKFRALHGCDRAEYKRAQRDEAWRALVGEEPIFDSDRLYWKEEVEHATAMLKRHGEEDHLPEANVGYFSYWMRYELLNLRGSSSQHLSSRSWSMVDYVENVRIRDGRWEFSIVARTDVDALRRDLVSRRLIGRYKEFSEFLKHFESETLSETDTRYWFPFGVVDFNYFYDHTQQKAGRNYPIYIVKRRKHPKRVVSLFALHRLGTVKAGNSFINLHRDISTRAQRDARDRAEKSKQAKLNSLWK